MSWRRPPTVGLLVLLGCGAPGEGDGEAVPDEICNGIDDDGDGLVDAADNSVTDAAKDYPDLDGDRWGSWLNAVFTCGVPLVPTGGDCNDENPSVHPGAVEACNNEDDDCDGLIDDAGDDYDPATTPTWWLDEDADGYGTASEVRQCDAPDGYSGQSGDCNDGDEAVNPGELDGCDGVDTNCSGDELDCVPAFDPSSVEDRINSGLAGVVSDAVWVGGNAALGMSEADGVADEMGLLVVAHRPSGELPLSLVAEGWYEESAWRSVGYRLAAVGDVDGDGSDDLVAAAEERAHGSAYQLLFLGPWSGEMELRWSVRGGNASGGADVDGDGLADVAVDAGDIVILDATPTDDAEDAGKARVELAGGDRGAPLLHPNLDGDGIGDLLLEFGEGVNLGVYPGPLIDSVSADARTAVYVGDADATPGELALSGDHDADGVADLLLVQDRDGVPSVLLLGSTGLEAPLATLSFALFDTVRSMTRLDDLDGDGAPEIAIGEADPDDDAAVLFFSGSVRGTGDGSTAYLMTLPRNNEQGTSLAWAPGTLVVGNEGEAIFLDTATLP